MLVPDVITSHAIHMRTVAAPVIDASAAGLMVSLFIGAVTGVMTKNWPAAIGTFVATELFLWVGSSLVFA